jgi:outer membrane receptor protein involved in Fe transport
MPVVIVTATRTEIPPGEATNHVTVITAQDIQQSAPPVLDDLLRRVPGFNTFRRSSSIVTASADDPEAQGVTLRVVGPGGASRALVLLDGIPVNDAFGGWIYWDEIPLESVDRIEVVEGGGSNLWGNEAEGGVINIISKRPETSAIKLQTSYGNRNTTADTIAEDYVDGPLRARLEGDFFNTSGWNIIKPGFRGPIDQNSSSIHEVFGGRLEYDGSRGFSTFLRGSFYHQALDLGTALRNADVTRGFINGGAALATTSGGRFHFNVYTHWSTYHENFATANVSRTTETRTQLQTVPSSDVGGFLTWTRELLVNSRFMHSRLATGGDFRLIEGQSRDSYFDTTGSFIADRKISSGNQNFFGFFLEDLYRPKRDLEIDLSVRSDFFQNLNGKLVDIPAGQPHSVATFPDRMRTATSPRIGARYTPLPWLALRGGLYEAFRAPTLAELYRQSSVEDLVLIPNSRLRPEFLQGGEIGLDLRSRGLTLGLTAYWNTLHHPISNVVTVVDPVTGADAARTRENLGRAQIRGYEMDAAYGFNWLNPFGPTGTYSSLNLTASFLRSEAKLVSNPPDSTLVGRRLALVPWQTLNVGLRYSDALVGDVSLEEQYQGKQWEDSDNHDLQAGYWITNLTLSRAIPRLAIAPWLEGSRFFLKFQNLFNRSYIIDLGGGIPKVGTPLLIRGGLTTPIHF